MLATCFSFHSHPSYTGGQLMVVREKYSLIFNCFVNILAAIILPQYWCEGKKRKQITYQLRLVSWGIHNWLRHTMENFLMARYWPTLICIHCVTIVIIIIIFTICLGTVLPFPWKFSRTSSRVALLTIQWGQHHHFQSRQGVLIPSAHPIEKSVSVALVSYLPLILHFIPHR
jgi:hypothetical protein